MAEFKHLDIEGLPEGWGAEHFGQLVNYALGRTPPRNDVRYWKDGTYPWVSISDMEPYGSVTSTSEKVTALAFEKVFRGQLVPEGSLLMSFKLTIGRIARLGMPALHNEAIISFRPQHKKVNEDYLAYYLSQINYADYQDKAIKGHTLNKGKIDALEIALPPVAEQQRIAQVLSTVQAAIEQQERLIRTTTELKQALMQKLFTEGLRGEAQKETEIGAVPESWEVSTIGAEANVTKLAGYEYTKHVKYTDEGEIIAIRGVNLKDGKLDLIDVKRIWRSVSEGLPRSQLHPGDVLLSYVGTVGSVALVEEAGKYHLAPNVAKLTPKDRKRLLPEFLLAYLRTDIGRADLFRSVSQTSQPVISMARIRSLNLPLPEVDEQAAIFSTLAAVDQKLDNAGRKHNALQALFRTLLHELMTGKVRIPATPLEQVA